MVIAELYKQSNNSVNKGYSNAGGGKREGLALAAEILKKRRRGLTTVQIAMDCNCSLDDVETIVGSI